jgi:MFS family permease
VHGLALGLGSMLARSVQCYLLCLVRVFQQAMRNVLTNVLTAIAADAPISTSDKGSLLAAIPLGYFLTQVPGGALADRIGAKTVMLTALALSAVCCLILPTAFDQLGVYGLLATLTTMGAVQGPMFPTSSVLLARWMPKARPGEPDEKAWGTSMLDIGISIGTLLIIPTTSVLAEWVGWRHTFHCIGGASLAFCALYGVFAASAPAQCWYISTAERDYLEANVPQPSAPSGSAKGSDGRTAESGNSSTSLFARIVGMPSAVALHPGLWAVFVRATRRSNAHHTHSAPCQTESTLAVLGRRLSSLAENTQAVLGIG